MHTQPPTMLQLNPAAAIITSDFLTCTERKWKHSKRRNSLCCRRSFLPWCSNISNKWHIVLWLISCRYGVGELTGSDGDIPLSSLALTALGYCDFEKSPECAVLLLSKKTYPFSQGLVRGRYSPSLALHYISNSNFFYVLLAAKFVRAGKTLRTKNHFLCSSIRECCAQLS